MLISEAHAVSLMLLHDFRFQVTKKASTVSTTITAATSHISFPALTIVS